MQNFKMSASEYLRCAPTYTISRLNNKKISGEGAQPPPQIPPTAGRGTPLPTPYPLRHLRRLASRAFGARPPHRPPTQKSWLRPCPPITGGAFSPDFGPFSQCKNLSSSGCLWETFIFKIIMIDDPILWSKLECTW